MDHIYATGTVSSAPPTPPTDPLIGFPVTSGMPGMSTRPGAYLFYLIVEELKRVELDAKLSPNPFAVSQVAQAIGIIIDRVTRKNNAWIAQRSNVVRPTFGADSHSTTLDLAASSYFQLGTLFSNAILANPINVKPGQSGLLVVSQDSVGGRQLSYGGLFEFPGGVAPVLSTKPFATDVLVYVTMPSGKVRIAVVGNPGDSNASSHVPVAGELLSQYCQSTKLVGTYADGAGGTFDQTIEAYSLSCGGLSAGTLISTYCSGVDKHGTYANGSGGTYDGLIAANSTECGYVPRVAINLTAADVNNYNLFNNRSAAYVAGKSDITLTVTGHIGSTSTAAASLVTGTGWAAGDTIKIINNGYIWGRGGVGGAGGLLPNSGNSGASSPVPGGVGGAGGPALNMSYPVTFVNNGSIASGGNGGNGAGTTWWQSNTGGTKGDPILSSQGGAGGAGAGWPYNGSAAGGAAQAMPAGYSSSNWTYGAAGGALGTSTYIVGNANVIWQVPGTRLGTAS